MRPYKGKDFGVSSGPSLLLLGESHYLPNYSTQHLVSADWYNGTSATLSNDELEWINTAKTMVDHRAANFRNKALSIWKNSFWEINEYGPRFADYKCVADHICSYNFFLRPAVQGKSLIVSRQDVEMANAAFRVHFEKLKPTAIIFLSRLASRHFHNPSSYAAPVISTPHPGCKWWNKVAKSYGNKRGRDVLADFIKIKTTGWPQSSTN